MSILLYISLPQELFKKPHLQASITIPEEAAVQNPITTEVTDNIQEAIRSVTGLEFNIKVVKEEVDGTD